MAATKTLSKLCLSVLDSQPYFSIVSSNVRQGATNAEIVRLLSTYSDLNTSEDAIRRFRKRHQLNIPGTQQASTHIDGDEAQAVCEPTPTPMLDDPDTMLRQRGLDPLDWYIDTLKCNEWEGLQKGGENKTKLYQTSFIAKRKRPELALKPARSDGWVAPKFSTASPGYRDARTVVVVGDHQAPFHDAKLHSLFCEWLAFNKPEQGVHLGDLMDFPTISRHKPDPENLAEANECIQAGYDILRAFVKASPDTKWDFMPGNHDIRLRDYEAQRAPEVYGLARASTPEVVGEIAHSIPHLLRLDELGINYIDPNGPYEDGQVTLSKHLAVFHGWKASQGSGKTALDTLKQTGFSIIIGHCFDEVTEILTPDGWKSHETLAIGDPVATFNRRTRLMEFQPIEAVYRYDHFKELVHMKGACLDLAVTEGHGLWTAAGANTDFGKWGETTAGEAFGTQQTFRLAAPIAQDDIWVADHWIQLAAWIMAEGHIDNKQGKVPWASVRIAQSDAPDGRLAELEDTLVKCGINFSKVLRYTAGSTEDGMHRNFDAYRYGLKDVAHWSPTLSRLLDENKTPTRLLAGLSARQAVVFLDIYTVADGHQTGTNSYQHASIRSDHIDFLQELAARVGWRSSLSENQVTGMKYLCINERNTVALSPDGWSRQPYDGVVWCVTVPNGTLVVRRNGKTAITLNTHRQSIVHHTTHDIDRKLTTLLACEAGCMCQVDNKSIEGRRFPSYATFSDWQPGFAVATVWDDSKFVVDLAKYVNTELLYRDQRYR